MFDPSDVRGLFYYRIFSSLRSTVNAHAGSPVTIYVESLDLSRFNGAAYDESLKAHLKVKYREKPIGVLVAVGAASLEFVLQVRDELWPGISVVFAMVDAPTFDQLKPAANVTGRITKLHFKDNGDNGKGIGPGSQTHRDRR